MKECDRRAMRYVRAPLFRDGEWVIEIANGRSPLDMVIETIPCGTSREASWSAYRTIKKEQGKGF